MSVSTIDMVTPRQEPLRRRYRERPEQAQIADHARAANIDRDPFHGAVVAGDGEALLDFGIHRAITICRIRATCCVQRWPPAWTPRFG
jgi:hypothetical protein